MSLFTLLPEQPHSEAAGNHEPRPREVRPSARTDGLPAQATDEAEPTEQKLQTDPADADSGDSRVPEEPPVR